MMDEKRFKINKESIDRLFPKTDPTLDYLSSTGYKSPVTTFAERINADFRSEELKAVMHATLRLGVEVDKEELLKALRYDRNQYEQGYHNGYNAGINANTWIPVTERLPERNGRYLTHCNIEGQSLVCVLYYSKIGGFNESTVTHWMPLPEPPKESEGTEEGK